MVSVSLFPTREIALVLGSWTIHWYGVLYVVAFLAAAWLLPRCAKYRGVALSTALSREIVVWAALGVLVGGRLGYALFYAPGYFLSDPVALFRLWEGGMSSHGGFIGVGLALWGVSRAYRLPFLTLLDVVVVPAALGLALGRIGNFINAEVYGPVTSLPWAVAIPEVSGLRHPTALYAAVKDLFLMTGAWLLLTRKQVVPPGMVMVFFLLGYAGLRFLLEFVRVPDAPVVQLASVVVTRGQLLSLGVAVVGSVLWYVIYRRRRAALTVH